MARFDDDGSDVSDDETYMETERYVPIENKYLENAREDLAAIYCSWCKEFKSECDECGQSYCCFCSFGCEGCD